MNPSRWINGVLLGIVLFLVAFVVSRFLPEAELEAANEAGDALVQSPAAEARSTDPNLSLAQTRQRLGVEPARPAVPGGADRAGNAPGRPAQASPLNRKPAGFAAFEDDAMEAGEENAEPEAYQGVRVQGAGDSRLNSG